jgi:5-formyltetrahydrofolate cyclo-ligase
LSAAPIDPARRDLRLRLRAEREQFATAPRFDAAHADLARHVSSVVGQLEPECLGLYWPIRSEFNAAVALRADPICDKFPWALPYTRRRPHEMEYRRWNREPLTAQDECGILAPAGAPVVTDVVLVPCVGFTRAGYRLGYGGGYFDRWLARHPHATAIGIAWSFAEIDATDFDVQPHDLPMMLIVTEHGCLGG